MSERGRPEGGGGGRAGAQLDGRVEQRRGLEPLRAELAASRRELAECRAEIERLRQRLVSCEREHDRARRGSSELEQQIAELGNLYVVLERLHGTLDHAEVLAALQDVVINVIGSEELAAFELSDDGVELLPVQTFGVEDRRLGPVPVGAGAIGRAASEGRAWIVGDGPPPPEFPDLTACVPLQAGGRVAGVLAIWRMLGHKPVFGPADREVLEVVAKHAATALHLTSSRPLRHERRAAAVDRGALP